MKILVIGGTGLIGRKLVKVLNERGHEAIAASPATNVNTITGEGLDDALVGVDTVVDVANSPSFEDEAVLTFFQTSTRNLLAAETRAGVRHHVAIVFVRKQRNQHANAEIEAVHHDVHEDREGDDESPEHCDVEGGHLDHPCACVAGVMPAARAGMSARGPSSP